MSRQTADRASRLLYCRPSLELPPCSHRLYEPRSSCIHTSGCLCLPWHCHSHLIKVRYGGCPSCRSRSSQTRLARYRFPSTSPSRHSQCLSSRRWGSMNCFSDSIDIPNKDSCFPIIITSRKILFGCLHVWLFLESLYLVDFIYVRWLCCYIGVTGLGTAWLITILYEQFHLIFYL